MAKLARIDFEEIVIAPDDADARAEILLLSPSILVPCLTYNGIRVWDTLAIGEFLNEIAPKADFCLKIRQSAPIAAPFAARCIPASLRSGKRCR